MTPAPGPRTTVRWAVAVAVAVAAGGPARGQQDLVRIVGGDDRAKRSKLVVTVPADYPPGKQIKHPFKPPVRNVTLTGNVQVGLYPSPLPGGPPSPVSLVWFDVPKGTGVVREVIVCTFIEPTEDEQKTSVGTNLYFSAVFLQLVAAGLVVAGILLRNRTGEVFGTRVIGVGSVISGLATLGLILACQHQTWADALGAGTRDGLVAFGVGFTVAVDFLQFGLIRAAVVAAVTVLGRGDALTAEEEQALIGYVGTVFPDDRADPTERQDTLDEWGLAAATRAVDVSPSVPDFAGRVVRAVRRARSSGPPHDRPPTALLVEGLRDRLAAKNPRLELFFNALLAKYPSSPPRTAEGNAMAWFDDNPLDFTREETRAAEDQLRAGYRNNDDALMLAENAGLDPTQLNQSARIRILVREILVQARLSEQLLDLFVEVFGDASRRAIHVPLTRLFAGHEGRLAAAAQQRKPSLATLRPLPTGAELWVAGAAAPQPLDAPGLEQILNTAAGFTDVAEFRQGLAEAEVRTARIDVGGKAKGTGFLVGDRLLLTNWHVVQAVVDDGAVAWFDHKFVLGRAVADQGRAVRFALNWDVAHSPHAPLVELGADGPPAGELWDYALVLLAEPVGADKFGPDPGAPAAETRGRYRLDGAAYDFEPNESLLIVGHPAGRPMQLSFASPSGVRLTTHMNRLRYRTNTEVGSSGSPVFNKDWRVVALHHAGGRTKQPGDLDKDTVAFNQGVPIRAVVNSLREQLKDKPDVLLELGLG